VFYPDASDFRSKAKPFSVQLVEPPCNPIQGLSSKHPSGFDHFSYCGGPSVLVWPMSFPPPLLHSLSQMVLFPPRKLDTIPSSTGLFQKGIPNDVLFLRFSSSFFLYFTASMSFPLACLSPPIYWWRSPRTDGYILSFFFFPELLPS